MSAAGHDVVLDGATVCDNPRGHAPTPRLLVHHHVKPESWGGTAADGLVRVCSTCHMNAHVLIDLYVKHDGMPDWTVRRLFDTFTRALANHAWSVRPATPTLTL